VKPVGSTPGQLINGTLSADRFMAGSCELGLTAVNPAGIEAVATD
jgi:hypothetical protein